MPATDAYIVNFNPVAFEIFGLSIHWYGISYLVAFVVGWLLARYLVKSRPQWNMTTAQVDDLLFYIGLGTVLGGRIGYLLFYDIMNIVHEPTFSDGLLRLVSIHKGGMSFHGGFLGILIALWLYNRRYHHGYAVVMDLMAILGPIGLFTGRIGNFINGELWGKPSDVPWAMVFPKSNSDLARHPTPLYEAGLEGLVLFAIVWWFARKDRPGMAVSGVFGIGYGVFRTWVEFYRLPDAHIGYLAFGWLTMGMLLSAPMIVAGMILLWFSYNKKNMQKA